MTNKAKAIFVILVGAIIGGATSSVTKIGLLKIPPFTFTFVRFVIASLCLSPLFIKKINPFGKLRVNPEKSRRIKFNRRLLTLLLISLLPTLNVALFVVGVKTTTASIAQMLYAGTPVLAGILSYFLFKNKLALKRWFFIFLGLIGVILVVALPLIEKNSLYAGDLKGNILISIGVIFWSLYFALSKHYQKQFSPITLTSGFFLTATMIFFFLSFFEISSGNRWWLDLTTSSYLSLLYIALISTVVSYLLHQYAIKFSSPVIASFSFYLVPIFSYISAFVLLGERLTSGLIIGTILVFISVALTTYSR
ncbi:hypothetical protein A3A46_01700 [Candidatus Roizmanbacteria bacterium RIFCSPLOWO2_01_FULL_37_13]|uniref:EamA domain-containing protein n=1 Tax=Candidatus Roizmanbacteria bacterium RIFCSPHIGHO2_02_FULL_38_11 TaxID=1802039 RepID=A0A1F7GZL2_9BACT|nr:MAG: hypothetical protein A3C25_05850 [Candidatus Roizmanbacteria bacterium RIFCSPHIGHO2_02_FULL_38_11]OGK34370.1 MAG: hypothetical protein A3F58_02730 [Candidatus Roizmanbacteria bacterium RIFCSPHIGHO2_12_FULL_37_9b]OGK42580.1 MAG: hypothetical protein A3A46_01700 [Candidatus Roizmanbacteria bacterium RIFCSPLOWO2_01_FULL_37_13]